MTESSSLITHTQEEWQSQALNLVQQTRRYLRMFTPDMEAQSYNNREFMEAVLTIIKRSRHTEIKILALNTKQAIEIEHCLLRLFRYSDTQFQLKTITHPVESRCAAYLIGDDNHLLRRQYEDDFRALCYTGDRARTKNQIEDFEQLWKLSVSDPSLRRLSI